ncbi:hypothetical protein SAMN04487983_1002259 [Streptomyces sp. yr375]|uniref:DUF6519 domain-containing protein n=1 Tax=Streptomyces sp. yr375 TaxID=1761906 RepID=UPI0008C02D5F|nr:DUF6519 domain-containing protein [Streptomyces sp. yr375]SEP95177.1 hypothetical protein SAMN04487983_1002259 [Streptomyces sp. yr375]
MHGDFSRVIFDPARRFSAVLSQQGRVQLDAEINEQTAILLHYVRTLATDLMGPAAYPPEADGLGGFGVDDFDGYTFTVAPGRMYVDGILCECDGTDYWQQPDGHLDPDHEDDQLPSGPFLVYLRVWERLVTAWEAPWIREVALGVNGPDTTARSRVVWQVCVLPLGRDAPVPDMRSAAYFLRDRVRGAFEPRGLLSAATGRPADDGPGDAPTVSTSSAASSGYRGPENQLYRVEVHQGGGEGTATYKWSRENGCVVLPVRSVDGRSVELETLGRDDKLGVDTGDVVELLDDASVCRGASDRYDEGCGRLYTVRKVDHAGFRVELDSPPEDDPYDRTVGQVPRRRPFLRRWDHGRSGRDDGYGGDERGLLLREGTWLPLEDGVQVRFHPGEDEPRNYRHGDYWLVPARVLTGDVEWPRTRQGQPLRRRPHGVPYHYAPLAYIDPRGGDDFRLVDLRVPLAHRR